MPGIVSALVWARVRHAGPRWWLVAAGLAVAAVLPVLTGAYTQISTQETLRRAVGALAPGDRSVTVAYGGLPDDAQLASVDRQAVSALGTLGSTPFRRELLYHELADHHGGSFALGATDQLAGAVRLLDGRLPASCTPTRCEVVSLVSDGVRDPDLDPAMGVVIVGHARQVDPLLLAGTFQPAADAPVLVADGVGAASRLAALSQFARSYGWVAPLDLDRVRTLGVDAWIAAAADTSTTLLREASGFSVITPDSVLRDEADRVQISSGRFGLLGGAGSVLLLGVAVVGGAALRRDHEAFRGALVRRGAARPVLAGIVAGEVTITVLVGALLGILVGGSAAGVLAGAAGLPIGSTAGPAVLGAAVQIAALALVAAVLLAFTLTAPAPDGARGARASRAVDAAALACLAAAALLVARGGVGARSAGSGGTGDPLLATLPALVLLASALGLARVWLPLTRLLSRHLPRRAVGARLGVSAAAGRPLRPVATAALLTAAVAAAVFAGAYRATLEQGARDEAAYAVPLDARLTSGRTLVRPLDAGTPQALAAAGLTGYPALRTSASVRISAEEGDAVQVLAVPPAALPLVSRWSAVAGAGAGDPGRLARLLEPSTAASTTPSGTSLPPGTTLRIDVTGPRITLALTAYVRSEDGRERGVELALQPVGGRDGAQTLVSDLPDLRDRHGERAPLTLVSIVARLPIDDATRLQHGLGEGLTDRSAPNGRILLGALGVDGASIAQPWRGWAGVGMAVRDGGATATVSYQLTTGGLILAGQPAGAGIDDELPVAADPTTSANAKNGALTLVLNTIAVRARIVATLPQFPTLQPGRFVLMDVAALERIEDLTSPGAGQPGELWVAASPEMSPARLAEVLASAPFDVLAVQSQADTREMLRTDPVARAASNLLALGAALMLAVTLAALVLLVVTERHDDAAQVYAWEADGVAPRTLRLSLWWRAVAVALPAVPAGVAAGLALSRLTARLVAVTATATAPQPPLVAATGVGWGLLAALTALALALAAAGAVAALSLREPLPVRRGGVPA